MKRESNVLHSWTFSAIAQLLNLWKLSSDTRFKINPTRTGRFDQSTRLIAFLVRLRFSISWKVLKMENKKYFFSIFRDSWKKWKKIVLEKVKKKLVTTINSNGNSLKILNFFHNIFFIGNKLQKTENGKAESKKDCF